MALTLITSVAGDGTTSAIDTTGADLLVVVCAGNQTPSVTDSKSNTWTGLTQQSAAGDNKGRLFYCASPTVGSGHTFTASASYETVAVLAFSGAAASPFDVENGGTGSSPLSTGSITPTQDDCVVVAGFGLGGTANTFSINGSFTGLVSDTAVPSNSYGAAIAYLVQTTAAAANPALTYSGGGGGNAMISSFKAAGGGGGVVDYTLTCAAGTYTTSGKAATLIVKRNYVLTCSSGTYTTSGKAATLTYIPGAGSIPYTLACAVGAYTFSGKAATLSVAHKLICSYGTYTTSGKAVVLTVAHSLQCASGTYIVSGKAATLTYTSHGPISYDLTCSSGTYSVSGKASTLTYISNAINTSDPRYVVSLTSRAFKIDLHNRPFRIKS